MTAWDGRERIPKPRVAGSSPAGGTAPSVLRLFLESSRGAYGGDQTEFEFFWGTPGRPSSKPSCQPALEGTECTGAGTAS